MAKFKKTKKIILPIIILVIVVLLGGTYALYRLLLFNDLNVNTMTKGLDYYLNYSEGSDFTGTLNMTDDYTGGNYVEVSLNKKNNKYAHIYGHIYLKVTKIGSYLREGEALRYTVTDGTNEISSGKLMGVKNGETVLLAPNIDLNVEPTNYRVYIWLDSTGTISSNASGQEFITSVVCEATQKSIKDTNYDGREIEKIAAEYITNLYLSNKNGTVTNNGIEYSIAPDVSLMNDRLGGTTSLDAGNIRYYGANPNNYVWLGDTYTEDMTIDSTQVHAGDKKLWRIIGVFDGKLKLVTDNIISTQGLSWDTSDSSVNGGYGINEWSQSDLMKLLNPGYEDESINNSLYWNKGSGTVYNGWGNSTTPNISFTSTGLSDSEKNMIEEVTWYTGAYDNISYADVHYKAEREDMGKICSSGKYCNDTVTRTNEWPGKVGLISVSDLGYSVDLNSCNTTLYNYNNFDCANNNWLVNDGWYWTMSPRANSSNAYIVFGVNIYGNLASSNANYGASVRPAVYLKSGVSISGGNGSGSDPYELR